MIKYPDPVRAKNNVLSYMNNQFSEDIGCKIFKSCGFITQDTELGYFRDKNEKNKVVVGCVDFTQEGANLHEFSKLGNQTMINSRGKINTTIENVLYIIEDNSLIKNKEYLLCAFWDMFVVDALIGNADRHFDNWGILERNGTTRLAPIYDCGSTLSALMADIDMDIIMKSSASFKNNEYNVKSCYSLESKRIFYHEIFKNPPDDLKEAIKRTVPKVNMDKIRDIIDTTPEMSDIRKEYLQKQ